MTSFFLLKYTWNAPQGQLTGPLRQSNGELRDGSGGSDPTTRNLPPNVHDRSAHQESVQDFQSDHRQQEYHGTQRASGKEAEEVEREEALLTAGRHHHAPQDEAMVTLPEEEGSKADSPLRTRPGRCVKSLHIFADLEIAKGIPELGSFTSLLESSNATDHSSNVQCVPLGYECDLRLSIGVDINSLKGKDAVIFGMVVPTWRGNTLLKDILAVGPAPGQTWIYYCNSTEPPFRVVRTSETLDVTRLIASIMFS